MMALRFRPSDIERRVRAAAVRTLDASIVMIQREIRIELSRPGRGRLYRRSRGRSTGRNLRARGFHRASAPGAPPAADTGTLRRSWQSGPSHIRDRSRLQSRLMPTIGVGTRLVYAAPLKYGTGRMAARPYVHAPIERLVRSGRIDRFFRVQLAKVVGPQAVYGGRA